MENTRLIGYSLVTAYCRQLHTKGGVAIYAKEGLGNRIEAVDSQTTCVEMLCEVATVKVTLGKSSLFIIGVYRTGNNVEEGLEIISEALQEIKAEKHPTLLIGDINIDCLNKKKDYTQLAETLTCYNIYRLDLPPTRITPTTMSSIDSVCTNLEHEEVNVEVINTGISDHMGQICTIQRNTKSTISQLAEERRVMSRRNLLELKELLKHQEWEEIYNTDDTNEAYNKFNCVLTQALNQACPVKKTRFKQRKSNYILNDPTAMLLKQRFTSAQNLYHATGREEHKRNTALLKKEYDLRLRHLRQQDNASKIAEAENKTKALWNVINSERKSKEEKKLPVKLNIGGLDITNPVEMADHLNKFFIEVADKTIDMNGKQNTHTISPLVNRNIPPLQLTPTNNLEISKVIRSLKTKTSAGYDEISSKVLKLCEDELTNPLVYIINKSFLSGIFPSALKLAKVYPKFKQGCTTQAPNYRPISLISTFSKVIEKIVLTRLLEHLSTYQLLTPDQHGFLTGKSTITALISLAEFIMEQLEEGNTSTAILLDYSKAFDCLSHEQLLEKLTTLGIQDTSKTWFSSYLTGRSQMVEITHTSKGKVKMVRSAPKLTLRGVPQGSVLGPVLFILFTNDFPTYMQDHSKGLMYADDTVLLLGRKYPANLEIDAYIALNMAIQYCHRNELVINEKKTKQLVIGKYKDATGRLPELEEITCTKYLGITIDDNLSWTPHIDSLCKKLSTALYVIRRVKSISDMATAKVAYYALLETHLRYGIVVWGGTTKKNMQRVLVLQKRAIRILGNLQYRETCRDSFKDLKILTVINLYILEAVTHVHIKAPESARTNTQIHQYNTRNASDYSLPVHRLTSTEMSPSYAGAKMWNTLPEELKRKDHKHFRQGLKNWLQDRPFYSLEEFYGWRT